MTSQLEERLSQLDQQGLMGSLAQTKRGIEKEGLRTTPEGLLAQTPHPKSIGSSLTHPQITTDYSEALLEFITPAMDSAEQAVCALEAIHQFVYSEIGDELIWSQSMPCFLGDEESIPIARYGSSNVAQLKYIYRVGLANRYGKKMQTIAGIHYNFSLNTEFWPQYQKLLNDNGSAQDFVTDQYFCLIRNFRRLSWLILYLFGASPALCPSFVAGRQHGLEQIGEHSLYQPYGTSLRMGDLGYTTDAQQSLNVCYNSLDNYTEALGQAIRTPYADFEAIGLKRDGEYQQLSTHLLQIENEYYSDIRPKRVTPSGAKPLNILKEQGVEYIELRNLDINPFAPAGIDVQQAKFLDSFLLYCLLQDSPKHSDPECEELHRNKYETINSGRQAELTLYRNNEKIGLANWAKEIFAGIKQIASILDREKGETGYSEAVASEWLKIENAELTPSAKIIASMKQQDQSFFHFGLKQAKNWREHFLAAPVNAEQRAWFEEQALQSITEQSAIEAADNVGFDEYLQSYLAQ